MSNSVKCLVDKGIISEDYGNDLSSVINNLPYTSVDLLAIIAAALLLEGNVGTDSSSSSSSSSSGV